MLPAQASDHLQRRGPGHWRVRQLQQRRDPLRPVPAQLVELVGLGIGLVGPSDHERAACQQPFVQRIGQEVCQALRQQLILLGDDYSSVRVGGRLPGDPGVLDRKSGV